MTLTDLPRRRLGTTDLEVARLGYGAMELRDAPRKRALSEREVGRLLGQVLDAGIDLIDTSIDYGLAEERIGWHLVHRGDEFVLASKCGCPVGVRRTPMTRIPHDHGADNVVAGVEQSLRRLRTDHLDLVQVHSSPSVEDMARGGTIEALQRLKERGDVRWIGMSGTLPHLDDHVDLGVFDAFQIPYSLLEPEHGSMIERAADRGAATIVRGATGRGVLAGSRQPRAADTLAARWERADLCALLGDESPSTFALRWALANPAVDCFIVGTARPAHVLANRDAVLRGPLDLDTVRQAQTHVTAALEA